MPSFSKLPSKEQTTDIVWIQTGFIGDIILTTAAIEKSRELFPAARQHLVTTNLGKMVLENALALDSIHVFDKSSGARGLWSTAQAVRTQLGTGAITFQPHLSTRSSLLTFMIGAPVITFREASLAFLAAKRVHRIAVLHEVDRNAALLEALGTARENLVNNRPKLRSKELPPQGPLAALIKTQGQPVKCWIGIAPGSIWGTKRWPLEKYTSLVHRLLEQQNLGIALIGGKDEQPLCQQIFDSAIKNRSSAEGRLLNLAGQTSLDDLRAVFPALDLVVTNDSSPIHYASAFNIPTVAIFGATIPAFGFGPLADNSVVVETLGLNCRPCGNHGPQTCPLGHFKCMNDLEVDTVFRECMKIFKIQWDTSHHANPLSQP